MTRGSLYILTVSPHVCSPIPTSASHTSIITPVSSSNTGIDHHLSMPFSSCFPTSANVLFVICEQLVDLHDGKSSRSPQKAVDAEHITRGQALLLRQVPLAGRHSLTRSCHQRSPPSLKHHQRITGLKKHLSEPERVCRFLLAGLLAEILKQNTFLNSVAVNLSSRNIPCGNGVGTDPFFFTRAEIMWR